jgi:hypothetical protein
VNRRYLLGASAVAIIALIAGVALGLILQRDEKPTKTAEPVFVAHSQYAHRTHKKVDFRVVSGTIRGAPRWPVIVMTDSEALSRKPWVIAGDKPNGPLEIVKGSAGTVLVSAKKDFTYSLEPNGNNGDLIGASLYPLGKRLDPRHLPALSNLGVAVPVQYGSYPQSRAVILVGVDRSISVPHIYGYLEGYSLTGPSPGLDRPLLGPDGALYRIDASARRLEQVAKPLSSRKPWIRQGAEQHSCKPWPGGAAGTYYACPRRIELVRPDGTRTTIFKDNCKKGCTGSSWEVVLPSPDGKTLLAQEHFFPCGGMWATSFLPRDGGELQGIPSGEFSDSWALGWLTSNKALVAARAPGECGPPSSGIYAVDRRLPASSTLVLATSSDDATIWRSK